METDRYGGGTQQVSRGKKWDDKLKLVGGCSTLSNGRTSDRSESNGEQFA